ncbi:hypothetical protein HanHA300_Chr10g0378461 [Helianthus annuus]|nr:hypothetical protein HanHA300_Chr10g0378461 [Helianthus annuus]KAJ0531432.1 hypothetical protein HanHA89_Chr10g0401011 [Helianthus annuus]KAJ0698275.1 hypothetical protein HanLR1_Chr10g0378251 [Helianthus annuus]
MGQNLNSLLKNEVFNYKLIQKKKNNKYKCSTVLGRVSIMFFKVTSSGSGSPICLNP